MSDSGSGGCNGHSAFAPLLAALIIMAAFRAAVMLVPSVCESLIPSFPRSYTAAAVRITFVLVLVLVCRRRFAKGISPGRRRQRPASLALCVLCGVLLQLSLASVAALILGADSIGVRAIPSDPASLATLFCAVAVTPICEEIVFRGAAYRTMRLAAGALPSALLTSLAFAISHGDAVRMAAASVCGLILAALAERHGSIPGAITLHAAFNLTSFFAGYLPLSPAVCLALFSPLAAACVILTIMKGTNQ